MIYLFLEVIIKFIFEIILVGFLLFFPVGSFNYINVWLLMALFIPMFIAGVILLFGNPDLLKLRLYAKEKQSEQHSVIVSSALMFTGGFIIAGLNYHYNWIIMPSSIVYFGIGLFSVAYILYAIVLSRNKYLSRTIEFLFFYLK